MAKIFILLNTLLFASLSIQAQSVIESGSITFQLAEVASNDDQVQEQMEMIKGSTTQLSFSDQYAMLDMNMMEGLISMRTLKDLDSGKTNIYINMMGNKVVVAMSKAESEQFAREAAGSPDNWEVTYDESVRKTVKGYDCYQAKVTNTESGVTLSCYITPKIKADTHLIYGFEAFDLKGFPLEYSTDSDGQHVTFTASEIVSNLKPGVFEIDTQGYTEMSFEDFTQLSKGMGSGMGF